MTSWCGYNGAIVIDQLRAIVGDGGVITGDALRARNPGLFLTEIGADAILRPRTTEEISQIMALCHAAGQPVVVHGGLSGWVRGVSTKPGEIALSLERMNVIEEVDTVNRTATVQAGVVLEALQTHLEPCGLDFALDLGGRGSCQLGGNAATNAGGIRVLRYGMMREQILGLEVVLADGQVVSSMNRMIKNNTGYDLKQLFIGSEGTLGVITRLVLRLRERPESSNTALVSATSFSQIAQLLRHMDGALGGMLSAFELVDSCFYRVNTGAGRHTAPLPADKPFYAIIETQGSDQDRDRDLFEQALATALDKQLFDECVLARSERERADIWNIREDLDHVIRDFQPFYAFDVSLPVGEMENYMIEVKRRLTAIWPKGSIAFLGHVADGNLHIAIGAGGADDKASIEACVYEPLRAMVGSVSAEHGIGIDKKKWLSVSRNAVERKIMQGVKHLFDPKNILNPGKIFDAEPPFSVIGN
jgi:FAD/FMN-containing dehydrogenase